MRYLLGTAVFLTIPAVVVLWQLVMIAILRLFGVSLPFSFAVHYYIRRERELNTALQGSSAEKYILVSGFFLFACPMLAAITTFDCVSDRYISHSPYNWAGFVGSVVIFAVAGVWLGISQWKKSSAKVKTVTSVI